MSGRCPPRKPRVAIVDGTMGTDSERPAGQPRPDTGVCNAATHALADGPEKHREVLAAAPV